MVDALTVVATVLLIGGVVGSLLPALPGPLFSLAGVYVYWFNTGFTDPGAVLIAVLTVIGVAAVLVDWAGGPLAARLGGASSRTAVLAGLAGVVGLIFGGPLGLVITVVLVAVGLEYRYHRDARAGLRAGLAALVGVLASPIVQTILTVTILVAMAAVALV